MTLLDLADLPFPSNSGPPISIMNAFQHKWNPELYFCISVLHQIILVLLLLLSIGHGPVAGDRVLIVDSHSLEVLCRYELPPQDSKSIWAPPHC